MKAHLYRTIVSAAIFVITIAATGSMSFADDSTPRIDEDFFALDGLYDHGFTHETPRQFELTSVSARLSSTADGEWPATASGEPESTRAGAVPGQIGPSDILQRPPVVVGDPFSGRPLDDDGQNALFKALGVGMFLASGADLASTELGLSQPGITEINPTQQNRALRVTTHVAAPAMMWWVSEKVHRGGKPKLALFMRIGFAVAYSYAVMHNVRTMNSVP